MPGWARAPERLFRTTQALKRFEYGPRAVSAAAVTYSGVVGNQPITLTGDVIGTGTTGTTAITVELSDTGVSPGSYTNTNLTVDVDGRITSASNGAGGVGGGTVTSVAAGTGLTAAPSPIVGAGTMSLQVPVTVANGGTGAATHTLDAILTGAGTGAIHSSTAKVDTTSGTLTVAGNIAGNLFLSQGASAELDFDDTAAPGAVARWSWYATGGSARLWRGGDLVGVSATSGMIIGVPTGSYKGAGTLNSTGLYVNNVAVLTGNQAITITGDVDGSGTTAIALTLDTVNGNVGTFASHTVNAKGLTTAAGNLTGDVTTVGAAATIANNTVTDAKLRQGAALTVIGRSANSLGNVADIAGTANQVLRVSGASVLGFGAIDLSQAASATGVTQAASEPAHTGDVTNTAGSLALTIANSAVTYAKMQNVAAARLLGNPTAGAAAPSEISLGTNLSFAGTVLNATAAAGGMSGMTAGQIPIAATATTVTSSANLSGDVVSTATLATTIQANAVTTTKINNSAVTYAKIQNVTNNRILGNTSGSAAAPSEITLPLAVANGGTGAVTLPLPTMAPPSAAFTNALLLGAATGAVTASDAWGSFGTGTGQLGSYVSSATQSPFLFMGRSYGTPGTPAATASAGNLGVIEFDGYGTGWVTGAQIVAAATEAFSATAAGTKLVFSTVTPTTLTNVARLTIGPGVQVGAPTGGDKGAGTLNATTVYAAGTVLTSDERLKRDIEPVPDGCLDLVAAILPKTFRFIAREDGPPRFDERRNWGFVAQDVGSVLPDAVEQDAEGNQYLHPFDLTAVLWRAVQELAAEVAALKGAAR